MSFDASQSKSKSFQKINPSLFPRTEAHVQCGERGLHYCPKCAKAFPYPEALGSPFECLDCNVTLTQSNPKPIEREVGRGGLHEQISDWCRGMGFYFVHSRTDKPTTTALGVTDFIIAVKRGHTIWIEVKRPGSKQTPAQLATQAHLRKLGHCCEVVHSMEEFLGAVIYGTPNPQIGVNTPLYDET